jgi:microcystin-dependent protein
VISSSQVTTNFDDIATAITGSLAVNGSTPITGSFKFADGSAAAPAITFTTDQDEGIYRAAEARLGFAIGGLAGFVMTNPSPANGAGLLGTNGAVLCPIGVIMSYAGFVAPPGWFLCYGQALSRAAYPELFGVIGGQYGVPDGNTFSLPDLRGVVTAGLENMGGGGGTNRITNIAQYLGAWGGEQAHILAAVENGPHYHGASIYDPGHNHSTYDPANLTANASYLTNLGSGNVNNNRSGTTGDQFTGVRVNSANGLDNTETQGNGQAHNNLQPTIMMNKIIFAGRA